MLRGRNDIGFGKSRGAALGLPLCFDVTVPENCFLVARREILNRPRRNLLLRDDVTEPPPSAGPRVRHVRLRFVFGETAGAASKLVWMQIERCCETRARGFGQHARHVVKRRDPVPAEMSPAGVLACVENPRHAVFFELVSDVSAVPRELSPNERVGVRANGLAIGRDVETRAVAPHLVMVDISLRLPVAIENLRRVDGLDHVEVVRVPVVIVADIFVVQPRQTHAFELGAFVLVVPVPDHDLAVGVEVREEDQDRVVEDALRFFVVPREEVVSELGRGLGSSDFGRVEAEGLAHDGLAFLDELPHFGFRFVRVLDLLVHFAQPVEIRHVLR